MSDGISAENDSNIEFVARCRDCERLDLRTPPRHVLARIVRAAPWATRNPNIKIRVALDVNIWDARKLEVLIVVLEYAGCSKWDVQKTVLDVATAEIKRITDRLEAAQPKKVKHGR